MSHLVPPDAATGDIEFETVGTGQNVYESPEVVEGRIKWLETPDDVISFVESGDVSDTVVVARGGTTTFLTMALNAGVRAVITLQGAPESHLGIVSREYGIPCVMSVSFAKGVRTARGEVIPADGVRVRLDVSQRPTATVSVESGAPVDDSPVADTGPAMSEEQMAQIALLLEKFGGVVPHGAAGDVQMRAKMNTRVLYLDAESLHRELTVEETNELIEYYTWNEWDALAARATEGESGLIPRQEYEAMGIMNCWFGHPRWMRVITERVGIDGLIAIGGRARREIGTKINLLHLWALATAPSFGRGITLELGLHDLHHRPHDIVESMTFARRLYAGLWGGGEMLVSMRDSQAPILDADWVERFTADRIDITDPQARSTFQRFNAAAEMLGFLLHFDNRLGLNDTGPYPTGDGGYVLVRDLFINEPAFSWSEHTAGLPYAVTIAMFFRPDSDLQLRFTDLATVFSDPANYLPYVDGVAVYARENHDTPMEDLRTLDLDDMRSVRSDCETRAAALYAHIAQMSQREKIRAGAVVYTAGFALPIARAAGVYDELLADHGFLDIDPAVEACYDTIVGGVATEMIPRLFLTGSWGNPVPEEPENHVAEERDEFAVLHALRVRGVATVEALAAGLGLDTAAVQQVVDASVETQHVKVREGRLAGAMLTPAGKARHVLLRRIHFDPTSAEPLEAVYQEFLEPNQAFKQLTTDWQLRESSGTTREQVEARLADLHAQVSDLLDRATQAFDRFGRYTQRLEQARTAFAAGMDDALARPMSDSYHDVWMEIHEDLLVTLGHARTEADG